MNLFKNLFELDAENDAPAEAVHAPRRLCEFSCKPMPITPELLQRLIPLRGFPLEELQAYAWNRTAEVYTAGTVLFKKDQIARYLYYLLDGVVRIETDEHTSYEMAASSELSKFPLCGGDIYSASCIASSKIQVLRITSKVLAWHGYNSLLPPLDFIDIEEDAIPKATRASQFFQVFYQDLRSENLRLRSIPDVVHRLRTLLRGDANYREVIDIMQVEPSLSVKLVQLSNSGLYLPGKPVSNCQNAVYRLGLSATKGLVIEDCLHEAFTTQDAFLDRLIHDEWRNSLFLSRICRFLAEQDLGVNPRSAQLAGLVAGIGKIPILAFAENFPHDFWQPQDLFNVLDSLHHQVGAYILAQAGFSQELVDVPLHLEDWNHNSGGPLSLCDIVILARLHALWGTPKGLTLPAMTSTPAYAKLPAGKLTPQQSLRLIKLAQRKVYRVMKVLQR
ncbi:MAG: HDOD domain-containing protein [Candidatus Methylumidiphilus sp.]